MLNWLTVAWYLRCSTTPNQQREVHTHPSHEVHSSSSVQQKCGHVDVAIVSGDVEGRETTLVGRKGSKILKKKNRQVPIHHNPGTPSRGLYHIPSFAHDDNGAQQDFPHSSKESFFTEASNMGPLVRPRLDSASIMRMDLNHRDGPTQMQEDNINMELATLKHPRSFSVDLFTLSCLLKSIKTKIPKT